MSNLTRKDFIRLTSWSLVAILLPVSKIDALSNVLSNKKNTSQDDFEQAKALAKEAKRYFYLKKYEGAQELFLNAIALAPAAIQFYDGLDNVFGAQNKYLESISLYKTGLLANPTIISFYDRAARSLMRLETGNTQIAAEYRASISSQSLLEDARALYQEALAIDSTKNYLNIGAAKIEAKINVAPLTSNSKINRVFKNLRTQNKNTYKAAINSKTTEEIQLLIQKIDTKQRRELYDLAEIERRNLNMIMQKKKYYEIILRREDVSDFDKFQNTVEKFNIDFKDSTSLKKIKISYNTSERFYDMIAVRRKFAEATRSFHAYLGLMNAMELAYRQGQANEDILQEALTIGYDLKENWAPVEQKQVDVVIKITKILLLQGKFDSAKSLLEETMAGTVIESNSINNKLILFYAKIFYSEGDFETSKRILQIGVKEISDDKVGSYIEENPKLEAVKIITNNKGIYNNKFKDNITLYYQLYLAYVGLNDTETVEHIKYRLLENNPFDKFVLTRN